MECRAEFRPHRVSRRLLQADRDVHRSKIPGDKSSTIAAQVCVTADPCLVTAMVAGPLAVSAGTRKLIWLSAA